MNVRPADFNKVSFWDGKASDATAFPQKLNFIAESQCIKQRLPSNLIFFQLSVCKAIRKRLLQTANPSYVGHMAQLSSLYFVNYFSGHGRCSHSSRWHHAPVCRHLLSKSVTSGDPLTRLPMNSALLEKTANLSFHTALLFRLSLLLLLSSPVYAQCIT